METIYSRLQSHTILIVEDDESTLKWLKRVLSIYFKEVYTASDALEALDKFNINKTDIVLADIRMPEVDGLTFLKKVASLSPETMRITMTAFNTVPYLNRAVDSGVHFYLKKPIDIDELLFAISSHMPDSTLIEEKIDLGREFEYDSLKKMLYLESKLVKLTKKELLLLELFLKNRHGFISLEVIEQNIWEEQATPDAIRMIIVGLRKKLYNELFENLKGLGYRINLP